MMSIQRSLSLKSTEVSERVSINTVHKWWAFGNTWLRCQYIIGSWMRCEHAWLRRSSSTLEVAEVAVLRQQWLHDALAVYHMFSEVNACEVWIDEKEQWLNRMEVPERLEDVEVIAHR